MQRWEIPGVIPRIAFSLRERFLFEIGVVPRFLKIRCHWYSVGNGLLATRRNFHDNDGSVGILAANPVS